MWSQQLEDAEGERRRQEAAHRAKIQEHERLSNLLGSCLKGKKGSPTLYDEISQQIKPQDMLKTSKDKLQRSLLIIKE